MNPYKSGAVLLCALAAIHATGSRAAAQPTVPFNSTPWTDFGSTNIVGVAGNFLPGWTTLTGTPDLGQNLFFIPTQSLSGSPTDGALWMLKFDQSSPGFGGNEAVELSLSGFTPGEQYRLDFFATLVYSSFASWNSQADDLQVGIVGADIPAFSTSVLTDVGDTDGVNAWTPQTILFTALGSVVNFRFNDLPVNLDPTRVARIGVDGMRVEQVPGPISAGTLAMFALIATRRRRT